MAGAVPQHRSGSNATTIGMVVSIVIAALLLGVLVWLITQQEQLRSNAAQATAARTNATREIAEQKKGIELLAGGMTGNQNDTPQVARAKLDTILGKIRSEDKVPNPDDMTAAFGAAGIIENLYQLYSTEHQKSQQLTEDLAKANNDLKAAVASNDELHKKFGADLAKLRTKVEELQSAKSDFEQLKNNETQVLAGQIGAKQDALDSLRRDQTKARRKLVEQLVERDSLLESQRQALSDLRGPAPEQGQELSIARAGVGRVLRALPGDALVHIDLGRDDNVRLGMTFSVYSADERIPVDGRGKAHVEVVSVGRRTAECRVTMPPSPEDPILEGDVIGNVVLSRDRGKKERFCIVGKFDIDFNGQPDIRGQEAIAALVRRYGGVVVDNVDAMTDYVVVGMEPAGTEDMPLAPGPTTPDMPADEESADQADAATDEAPTEDAAEEDSSEEGTDEESGDAEAGEGEEESGDESAEEAGSEEEGEAEEGGEESSGEEAEESEEGGEDSAEEGADEGEEEPAEEEDSESGDEESSAENAMPLMPEQFPALAPEDGAATSSEDEDDAAPPAGDAAAANAAQIAASPSVPLIARQPEIDPTEGPRARRTLTERERYDEAIRRARLLSIPRLTQDHFFNFIGLDSGREAQRALEQ